MPLTSMRPACQRADHDPLVPRIGPGEETRRRRRRWSTTLGLILVLAIGLPLAAPRAFAESPDSPESPAAPLSPQASVHSKAKVAPVPVRPGDLGDLNAWLSYRHAAHLTSLPDEARLFYRRGRMAARAGRAQEAIRLVRGAAELDPSFLSPHLTIASWSLLHDPTQTLLSCAAAIDLVRRTFLLQIETVANTVFFLLQGLFIGIVATALILVLAHQAELRHMIEERLRRLLSPTSARIWGWVLLIGPFVAGAGLALPALVCLGALWPVLWKRERAIFLVLMLALVAAPFSSHLVGRLAMPLRDDRGPLFGIGELETDAWSPAHHAEIERLATQHPEDPYVLFGLAWSSAKAGDLYASERAYRRVLATWDDDARVLNNLANVEVGLGNAGSAIDLYRRAVAADPHEAAAYFNLSQVFTRQYDYQAASEAAAHASAIDFELVKAQMARATDDGDTPLVDQWLAPATVWKRVLSSEHASGAQPLLPFAWRGKIETSGWPYAVAVLVLGLASLGVGIRCQRAMPLRACRNCGEVVCRRCETRRRELALCSACADQQAGAESPEFVKVLLGRRRGQVERRRRLVRTTIAALLPGYGLITQRRALKASLIITSMASLGTPWWGGRAPFAYQSAPGLTENTGFMIVTVAILAILYLDSLLGYVIHAARPSAADAVPLRGRSPMRPRTTVKAA